jgi:hypothetical protein
MGKHSKQQGRRTAQRRTIATLELVDTTGTAHRVTVDAAADGLPRGRYAPSAVVTCCPLHWWLARRVFTGCAPRSPRRECDDQ